LLLLLSTLLPLLPLLLQDGRDPLLHQICL
jgi:hypothetical protein